ncbi:MAG: hypothetical protein DSY42_02000, partial [Aquifex sp.]
MAPITLIDNYDSFTYNLVHYLGELGSAVTVYRNDAIRVTELLAQKPRAIVLSPGPCTPNEAGITVDLIKKAPDDLPILGVCLGHQSIAQAFGGKVVRAPKLMHGKMSKIHHKGEDIFKDLPSPFIATRYHSLIVEEPLPPELEALAYTAEGELIAWVDVSGLAQEELRKPTPDHGDLVRLEFSPGAAMHLNVLVLDEGQAPITGAMLD